jgi:hypothetical protein
LARIKPENVDPAKCVAQVWTLLEKRVVERAKQHWDELRSLRETIDEADFRNRSLSTYKRMNPVLTVEDEIKARANLRTSE